MYPLSQCSPLFTLRLCLSFASVSSFPLHISLPSHFFSCFLFFLLLPFNLSSISFLSYHLSSLSSLFCPSSFSLHICLPSHFSYCLFLTLSLSSSASSSVFIPLLISCIFLLILSFALSLFPSVLFSIHVLIIFVVPTSHLIYRILLPASTFPISPSIPSYACPPYFFPLFHNMILKEINYFCLLFSLFLFPRHLLFSWPRYSSIL
jgi:hypothetical protein